jgi:hypothetical protein
MPIWFDLVAFSGNYRWWEDDYDGWWDLGGYEWIGPLGAVVATANLVDCLPIFGSPFSQPPDAGDWLGAWQDEQLTRWRLAEKHSDGHTWEASQQMADQLPYGDFTVGRWAWLLEDVKPTSERCPACWGEGVVFCADDDDIGDGCSLCWVGSDEPSGVDPIPAKGRQGLWDWGGAS